jgi:GH15 family glucan-1,4-alpha-glucosidase
MSTRPISDYALLSDCHGAALASRAGSIDWLCLRRFDAPAVFARLLGEDAGHWSISPVEEARVSRRYRGATMVLETTFTTGAGEITIDDALAVGVGEEGHQLGAGAPHALLRRVRCTRGRVALSMEYAPRPEYGLVVPILAPAEGGVYAHGAASVLLLSCDAPITIEDGCARAMLSLSAGERARSRPRW